jgi:hypothetical protein
MQTMASIDPLYYFAVAILLVLVVGWLLTHGDRMVDGDDEPPTLNTRGDDR